MKTGKLLMLFSLVGLLATSCGDDPQVDYITPLRSMRDNVLNKYEGPLTFNMRMYGSQNGETNEYNNSASYDSEGHRFYSVRGSEKSKTVFVPNENSKIGTRYVVKEEGNSYKCEDVYSSQAKKYTYQNCPSDLFSYLKLIDSIDLLKEYADYYSLMYLSMAITGPDLVIDPVVFSYSFSTLENNVYKFTCTSSRVAYVTKEEEKPNCRYQNMITITYDKEYLYSMSSNMSMLANYSDGTNLSYSEIQEVNFELSFATDRYNQKAYDMIAADLPAGMALYNTVTFVAHGCSLTTQTVGIGAQIDFASVKSEMESRLDADVEGFYLDEGLTQKVTSLISEEAQQYIYMKLNVKDDHYFLIKESYQKSTTLPGDYLSPELYEKLYSQENSYTYFGLETPAFNEEVILPFANIENSQKIIETTLDNEPYDTYKATFSSGTVHRFKKVTVSYNYNKGYSEKTAVPVSLANSIINSEGIYLRSFSGSYCWYKIHTSELKKANFSLEFKDYESDRLLTTSNISSLRELDKSGASIIFIINNQEVTSIPEGYEGDIYFQTYYEGPAVLHYLLIG